MSNSTIMQEDIGNLATFLSDNSKHYLNNKNYDSIMEFASKLDPGDYVLYEINSITFKKDAPRREALENVLSSLRIEGINFIYLILGSQEGTKFYYGIAKDYSNKNNELDLSIDDIGNQILEPSIKGNFRGSKISKIKPNDKRNILSKICNIKYKSMIEGVPGILDDEDEFQGVDRLADIMFDGSEFAFMIISSLISDSDLNTIRNNIFDAYSICSPISKQNIQLSNGVNYGISNSTTIGKSESFSQGSSSGTNTSKTTSTNQSTSIGTSKTESNSTSHNKSSGTSNSNTYQTSTSEGTNKNSGKSGTSRSGTEGKSATYGNTESKSDSKTKGLSTGKSENKTNGSGTSQTAGESTNKSENTTTGENNSDTTGKNIGTSIGQTLSAEQTNKQIQDWMKYIDEILLPRIDYGSGKGMFVTGMFCFANNKSVLQKLENTTMSLFSGEVGNKIPLRAFELKNERMLNFIENLQLPKIKLKNNELVSRSLLSQKNDKLGSLLSSKELSLIAGLPKKDILGLELREEVEFGLNFQNFENKLELGKLVQSGHITNTTFSIDKDSLDKHIFIAGVTGSGKTTTCQNILEHSNKPFLVIEPAKTEYRILQKKYPDLLVFTLGNDNIAPFRLNPFEFFPHENITSRVDMIKASIEAAFDMEAAIPQIIESAIYECYKDKGWNIATNKNSIYGDKAFDDGVYSFPTLKDLNQKIEEVVENQGFDDRLKKDYIGSIKARLNGLLVGSKGFMLNTKRSINFKQLLSKKVVFELDEIRNGSEKSLIMGFILTNLLEAIKSNFMERNQHGLNHIILIEEAHRLLSKYQPGDSQNKKQGVEVFTDMLAEIRKYGECLMVADQIPNKLAPEVLKNTNTKIVHKIFAADDKEAIGNTMALEKEQAEFLSKLEVGRAIVFSNGLNKSVAVQINQSTNTTGDIVNEEDIHDSALEFYAQNSESGIIFGSNLFEKSAVNKKIISDLLEFEKNGFNDIFQEFAKYPHKQKIEKSYSEKLANCIQNESFNIDFLAKCMLVSLNININKINKAKEFIQKCINDSFDEGDIRDFNDNLF